MNIAICVQQQKNISRKEPSKKIYYVYNDFQQLQDLIHHNKIDLVILNRKLPYYKQAQRLCKQFHVRWELPRKKKPIRTRIHHLFINEHGSVSIYLIIVVVSLFLFNAILIDYARILVAENQTDTAAKMAIRSTMSSFNSSLHEYGLFGMNDSNPTSTFQEAFAKNLSVQQSGYYHFAETEMVKGKTRVFIDKGKMLSNENTFKHQIVEDMKYQAPIQFTSAIIDGLMKASDSMEQASAFADLASDIDKKAKVRKQELDQAKKDLNQAKTTLENMQSTIRQESTKDFPSVNIMEDIVDNEDTYKEVLSSKGDHSSSQNFTKSDAINFESDSKTLMNQIVKQAKSVETHLNNAVMEINKARKVNQSIKKTIDEKRKQKSKDYATTTKYEKKYGENTNSLSGVKSNLEKANNKLNDYVMDDDYFTTSVKKIKHALKEVSGSFIVELVKFNNHFVQQNLDTADRHAMDKKQIGIESRHKTSLKDVNQAYSYFTENRKSYQNKDTKKKQDEAKKNLKKDKSQLDSLLNQAKTVSGDAQIYKTLRKLADKYNGTASVQSKEANMKDPHQTSNDSMALMGQLFHHLGTALKSERNQIYINEYILTRFKSHDFSNKGADAYTFDNNQVEYIIYGLGSTHANIAAAMGEIFTIRFAINFLAAFTDPEVDATGPFAFWTALATALENTIDNIIMLSNGEKIRFLNTINYHTGYEDYLRMILFLHQRGNQLQRCMAVINYKTNIDLSEIPTYLSTEVSTKIKLWFVPQLSSLIVKSSGYKGYVKGKALFISKKLSFSY